MGLFGTLNIGTRALAASQLAMDVAGQNIANADVEGYSRKRLNQVADYRYDSLYGQMGMGVEVINIERMRDEFLDTQIQRQNQEVGFYAEIDYTMESIENILSEPGDTGILTYIDQFFDSWENLANNPSDTSARNMVKTNAEILTGVFHNIGGEMVDLRQSRNEEIAQQVEKVNSICEDIFNLNLEIATVEINNQNANDSRDKRDTLLKELSKIIDITVVENDLGQITVTTGGSIVVSPAFFQKMELMATTIFMSDGTEQSQVGVRFANSKNEYKPTGGQIKGLLESRDTIIPEYQKKIDELALLIAEKVNAAHTSGYNLNGFSGIPFFNEDTTGALDIAISSAINTDVNNIAAASAGNTNVAEENVLSAGTHDFGSAAVQLYRDPAAVPPVAARNIVHGSVVVATSSLTLTDGVDYHINYTNGTIQMLHAGYDAEDITVDFEYRTGGGFSGPGDNSNALNIAQLRTELTMEPDVLGNPTVTFAQYYSSVIGVLGLNRNGASSNLETRQYLVDQYESQQDAIAGVSLDEEMANIVKYQNTYAAAARIITVTGEMLDALLNM